MGHDDEGPSEAGAGKVWEGSWVPLSGHIFGFMFRSSWKAVPKPTRSDQTPWNKRYAVIKILLKVRPRHTRPLFSRDLTLISSELDRSRSGPLLSRFKDSVWTSRATFFCKIICNSCWRFVVTSCTWNQHREIIAGDIQYCITKVDSLLKPLSISRRYMTGFHLLGRTKRHWRKLPHGTWRYERSPVEDCEQSVENCLCWLNSSR